MELAGNFERAQFNYEQCIKIDHSWYPSYFGLSGFYNLGQDKRGDHYFYLFESMRLIMFMETSRHIEIFFKSLRKRKTIA